ncbi:AMP-binding protein [Bdellovibrio sp. HCB2-146]|uniref:AMP-binding protein n=1 Tax=Bdellovibrio sp. HCB2-146 TaxID=3394362 RepID=UPI0039BD3C55
MEKPWLAHYEKGVAAEISFGPYNSLNDLLNESLQKYSSRPAFYNLGRTLTFAGLDRLSSRFAAYLQNQTDLKPGDRVAIMLPNILQYPVALYACLRAGLIVVNVNPLYTARELEHQLKDSGARAIVVFDNAAATLQEILERTQVKYVFTTAIGDFLSFPKSAIVNFLISKVKKLVKPFSIPHAVRFSDACREKGLSFTPATLTLDSVAFLQYTGGTTGVSKGAVLTHGNMLANLLQARMWVKSRSRNEGEVIITALPLYHIFSLTANCFTYSSMGALNVLITNPKDIPGFVKELKKWKFTAITGVNTLFNALLNNPDFAKLDFSRLKMTLGGGMAVQGAVAKRWKEVTGTTLLEAYGLTETAPAACINPGDLQDYNGYIGLPISSTLAKILDDQGNPLPYNAEGELALKGPQVMKGYWNRDDETAKVMTADGFFKTGDMALMTPDGFIKIVDRKKDMILVSGFNVYPNEVEEVACSHPGIFEAAAVGVPDAKSGEIVKLFVVKKDPSLTEEQVIRHCRAGLTSYKVPKVVEFRESLPKTNVGKILRRELR